MFPSCQAPREKMVRGPLNSVGTGHTPLSHLWGHEQRCPRRRPKRAACPCLSGKPSFISTWLVGITFGEQSLVTRRLLERHPESCPVSAGDGWPSSDAGEHDSSRTALRTAAHPSCWKRLCPDASPSFSSGKTRGPGHVWVPVWWALPARGSTGSHSPSEAGGQVASAALLPTWLWGAPTAPLAVTQPLFIYRALGHAREPASWNHPRTLTGRPAPSAVTHLSAHFAPTGYGDTEKTVNQRELTSARNKLQMLVLFTDKGSVHATSRLDAAPRRSFSNRSPFAQWFPVFLRALGSSVSGQPLGQE